jgi:hypothetical protein
VCVQPEALPEAGAGGGDRAAGGRAGADQRARQGGAGHQAVPRGTPVAAARGAADPLRRRVEGACSLSRSLSLSIDIDIDLDI